MTMTPNDFPAPSTPDLSGLISRARAADGQPPFSDQALVDLRTGSRNLLTVGAATAILGVGEAEFVVEPDARGNGVGTAMLERILVDTADELLIWAHGDHPAARALAASHGLTAVRTLLQLRGEVNVVGEAPTRSITVFRPGIDEDEWVALNADIFSFHAEQGSVTRADLEELEHENWFDAGDFLIARDGDHMIGYCWLKVEHGQGEIYVIGVDSAQQGTGLGRALMAAGYARLAERGVSQVSLYVEGNNTAALALYRSLGFVDYSVDIQYSTSAR